MARAYVVLDIQGGVLQDFHVFRAEEEADKDAKVAELESDNEDNDVYVLGINAETGAGWWLG